MLMVTATSADGNQSTRRATDKSVSGITEPGDYWAVETRRTRITEAVIAWFFATEEDAHAKAAAVNSGSIPWKDSDQINYDARVVRAKAYEDSSVEGSTTRRPTRETKVCPVHLTALPVTGRCDDCQ